MPLKPNTLTAAFVAGVISIAATAQASTTNLITNGDFEAGNTGFTTDLTFTTSNLVPAAVYAVVPNANALHSSFSSAGDNTSGSSNMMAINGTTTTGTQSWGQSVSVVSGASYDLSFYLMSLFGSGSTTLNLVVDGATVLTATNAGGVGEGVWEQFTANWTAATTGSVVVEFIEQSTGFGGNDYALDDISMFAQAAAVPLPASAPLLIAGIGLIGAVRKIRG